MFVRDDAFDCRVLLENRTLELGMTYDLPVKFLRPDLALPLLAVGTPVRLWEGHDIATGHVADLS